MKTFIICLAISLSIAFSACVNNQSNDSIVGTWKEYRTNGDDYLLSSWKFNADGSGLFTVGGGYSNKQQIAFTWKDKGDTSVEVNMYGDYQTLEINNGLLIEKGSWGTIVYKK